MTDGADKTLYLPDSSRPTMILCTFFSAVFYVFNSQNFRVQMMVVTIKSDNRFNDVRKNTTTILCCHFVNVIYILHSHHVIHTQAYGRKHILRASIHFGFLRHTKSIIGLKIVGCEVIRLFISFHRLISNLQIV